MGVRCFKHRAGCWRRRHLPQPRTVCLCYCCSRTQGNPSRNTVRLFRELCYFPLRQQEQRSEAVLGGNHPEWDASKWAANCPLLLESFWPSGLWGCVVGCVGDARWAVTRCLSCARSSLALLCTRSACRTVSQAWPWRSKELPSGGQVVRCASNGSPTGCRPPGTPGRSAAVQRISFWELLGQFRSVLGKTFLPGCPVRAVAVVLWLQHLTAL